MSDSLRWEKTQLLDFDFQALGAGLGNVSRSVGWGWGRLVPCELLQHWQRIPTAQKLLAIAGVARGLRSVSLAKLLLLHWPCLCASWLVDVEHLHMEQETDPAVRNMGRVQYAVSHMLA